MSYQDSIGKVVGHVSLASIPFLIVGLNSNSNTGLQSVSSPLWSRILGGWLLYLVFFLLAAGSTFLMARLLRGNAPFLSHSQEFASANLKSVGAILLLIIPSFIAAARPASWVGPALFGIFLIGIGYFSLKWFSSAIAFAHGFSENRGCLTMFPMVLLSGFIFYLPALLLTTAV